METLKLSTRREEELLLAVKLPVKGATKATRYLIAPTAGRPPFRAHWLASATILLLLLLIVILSIATTIVTPSNTNPLNNHLFQQVTKPFLNNQRERKLDTGNSSISSSLNMKIKKANLTASPTASSSSSTSSSSSPRIIQQKRPIVGVPSNSASPIKLFKALPAKDTRQQTKNNTISSQLSSFTETLSALGTGSGQDQYATPDMSRQQAAGSRNVTGNDLNNNSPNIASHDINNNTIQVDSNQHNNRNVNSVNGTIDLSLYANSDVDRLYGDALLVYLKNFNE